MPAFRHALVWVLLLPLITPAIARSEDEIESHLRPFHGESIASFEDVWQEPPIELTVAETMATSDNGGDALAVPETDLPMLRPTPAADLSGHFPDLLSPTSSIPTSDSGVFEWLFGMFGVVGMVALGGVYWIHQNRRSLEVRHSTERLQLSSALSLPRRSGLFLVDVEDQSVLVAIDGGGIRQVVPLGSNTKPSDRRAANRTQRGLPPSASEAAKATQQQSFLDVYQEQTGLAGDVQAVLKAARFATKPSGAAANQSP